MKILEDGNGKAHVRTTASLRKQRPVETRWKWRERLRHEWVGAMVVGVSVSRTCSQGQRCRPWTVLGLVVVVTQSLRRPHSFLYSSRRRAARGLYRANDMPSEGRWYTSCDKKGRYIQLDEVTSRSWIAKHQCMSIQLQYWRKSDEDSSLHEDPSWWKSQLRIVLAEEQHTVRVYLQHQIIFTRQKYELTLDFKCV